MSLTWRTRGHEIDVGRDRKDGINYLGRIGEPPTLLSPAHLVVNQRRHSSVDRPADVQVSCNYAQRPGVRVQCPFEPNTTADCAGCQRNAKSEPARAAKEVDNAYWY